jgi:hypothetical protein
MKIKLQYVGKADSSGNPVTVTHLDFDEEGRVYSLYADTQEHNAVDVKRKQDLFDLARHLNNSGYRREERKRPVKTILTSIVYGEEEKNEKVEFGFDEAGFYLKDYTLAGKEEHYPFRNRDTLVELQAYRRSHYAVVDTAKNLFPDWNDIPEGQWSLYSFGISSEDNLEIKGIEFGLFHEDEYSKKNKSKTDKNITLNIFLGKAHIFCRSILL